jgi:hypothetical protein
MVVRVVVADCTFGCACKKVCSCAQLIGAADVATGEKINAPSATPVGVRNFRRIVMPPLDFQTASRFLGPVIGGTNLAGPWQGVRLPAHA